MKLILIVLALFLTEVLGGDIFDRPCRNNVPAKENFSSEFYAGIWYELHNNEHAFDGNCITHRYARRGIQHVFDVDRSFIFEKNFFHQATNVSVTFPDEIPLRAFFNGTAIYPDGTVNKYNYQVYATDYSNYSLLWSCRSLDDDKSMELVSILGRSSIMSEPVLAKAHTLLELIGFNSTTFRKVSHSEENCEL